MQPEIIQSMHQQVRAIHRALTGCDVADDATEAEPTRDSDEAITRRFAELDVLVRTFPSVMDRVPPFTFTPPADVVIGGGEAVVELAVPGVDRDDVTCEVMPGGLSISGIRRDSHAVHEHVVRAEIPRGPFFRTIPLDAPVEGEPRIEVDRGVLRVSFALGAAPEQQRSEGEHEMRMETNEVQRLSFAIQAAMRAAQGRGGGAQEWGGQPFWQQQPQIGMGQLDEVRNRVKQAVRERVVQRLDERVSETVKECVRQVLRDRLENELRSGMLEAQSERGFDFTRMEKRLSDRLSDLIHEQVIDALRERTREAVRERLAESIRDSISGIGIADEERIAARIREGLESELTERLIDSARERTREHIRRQLRDVLRDRLQGAFQTAVQRGAGEPIQLISTLRDGLVDAIQSRLADGISDRLREVVRERVDDIIRQRLDDVVRHAMGEQAQGMRKGGGMAWGSGAQTQLPLGDGVQMVETIQRTIHDSLRDRFVDALREHVVRALEQGVEDVLRERLGTAVRASFVEQKLLGGFEPDTFADAVRGRIAYVMRERLTDSVRERLHEVHRDRLREAIRSAVTQLQTGAEFTGFGTGMH